MNIASLERSRFIVIAPLLLPIVAACIGCTPPHIEEAPSPVFQVTFYATSDPDKPLSGIDLLQGSRSLGSTDQSGHAVLTLEGIEGTTVEVTAHCPNGYESSTKATSVLLRHFRPGSPKPQYTVQCTPLVRTVVAAIHAINGPNLPVMRLGKEIAKTNDDGIAHVMLEVHPGEAVELTLPTEGPDNERLRPRNPSLTFVTKERDDYVLLEQRFLVEKPPKAYIAPKRRPARI